MKEEKKYPEEFKKQIVELYKNGKTVINLAREYGLVEQTIYKWIHRYESVSKDEKGNDNLMYLLCHLSGFIKDVGDDVSPGEDVAYVGNTGNSFGSHLHLQMYLSEDLNFTKFIQNHGLITSTEEQSIPLNDMEIVNAFNYMETYKNEK